MKRVVTGNTPEGEAVIAHYDKQSALLVRQEVTTESPRGKETQVQLYGDYREVDGIAYPFSIKILVGPTEVLLRVERVEHNVAIPEERFALPAEVNRLLQRQKKQ